MAEVDQPVAILMREGSEEDSANDAEDCGVRPYAEPERENDGQREAGDSKQASGGVAKVGEQHGGLSVGGGVADCAYSTSFRTSRNRHD
jgi:hypothetical protein